MLACPDDRRRNFIAGCGFFFERRRAVQQVMGFARAQPILRATGCVQSAGPYLFRPANKKIFIERPGIFTESVVHEGRMIRGGK